MKKTIRSVCLITEEDVVRMEGELHADDWKAELYDFWTREPELAAIVALRMKNITAVVRRARLPQMLRDPLLTQLPLLVWPALLLMHRAHRRAWNEVLPSERVYKPRKPPPAPAISSSDESDDAISTFDPGEQIEGVAVGIHIGRFQVAFPELDDETLISLLKQHSVAIAHEMLEAGLAAAERLFQEDQS